MGKKRYICEGKKGTFGEKYIPLFAEESIEGSKGGEWGRGYGQKNEWGRGYGQKNEWGRGYGLKNESGWGTGIGHLVGTGRRDWSFKWDREAGLTLLSNRDVGWQGQLVRIPVITHWINNRSHHKLDFDWYPMRDYGSL